MDLTTPPFDDWTIPGSLWDTIRPMLHPGMTTLEAGSGLSTLLFDAAGCWHTALEHSDVHAARSRSVVRVPLVGDPPWYDWSPESPFDFVLIDGPPQNAGGRDGVLRVVSRLLHHDTIVVLDDTHRTAERRLTETIGRTFSYRVKYHQEAARGFAVLSR